MNTHRRRCLMTLSGLAAATLGVHAWAQAGFPSRPITLVVPFAPGGIADLSARAVTQAMSATLGQPFVVDNRPSAGSIVGSQAVAAAAPDGHTLLLMSNANAVSAGLFRRLPFDAVQAFSPVGTLGFFDLALFVPAGSRFNALRPLIDDARARPGKLTVGTIAIGSTQHLAAELFLHRAGIEALVVPYKGTPAVLTALRAGEIDLAFEILGPMLPQLNAAAVRVLAVTGSKRFAALPEVPTVQEAGVPDYDVASWNGLAAPAGTPVEIVARLNKALRQALESPEVLARLQALGVRGRPGTPEALHTLLVDEIRRWSDVIARARIEKQ